MRRLGPADTRFLDLEVGRRPMHTLKIAVLKSADGGGFESVRNAIGDRLQRVPTMRWRLAFPPGGIGRPGWVEDDRFNLDHHLVRKRVAEPGGMRQLCELVAEAAEAPLLDRSRPLWQVWIADGLEDGQIAVIARVHHAFADGVSFARILASWFAPGSPTAVTPAGAKPTRLRYAARALAAGSVGLARDASAFLGAARSARGHRLAHEIPRAPFSGAALGARRAFACQPLPLAAIHATRKPLGATVNDLLLALVAGAVGGYLRDRAALPATPLVALMPVSLLSAAEQAPFGNRGLATTKVDLPTNIVDPVKRLRAASLAAKAAKDELAATRGARLDDFVDLLPRSAVRGTANLLDSRVGPALGNLSLSNVRGPAERLAADGFVVEDFFSVGPCGPGVGLNLTAWSYADRFNVALLADAASIPEPWEIAERLPEALEELARAGRSIGPCPS